MYLTGQRRDPETKLLRLGFEPCTQPLYLASLTLLLHANFPIVMKEVVQNILAAPDKYLTAEHLAQEATRSSSSKLKDVLQKTLRVSGM